MKKTFLLGIIFLQTIACQSQKSNTSSIVEISPEIDELVQSYQDLDIFSGVVLVAEHGKPIYHKAYGLANREKGISNTLNTKFTLGSMNKSYTSVVILQMIEEGLLNLDTKLVDVLDGFNQPNANKITVEHLLNHTSGFGDYVTYGFFDLSKEEKSLWGIIDIIRNQDLLFPPGEDEEYSNSGFMLLGGMMEKITGKSYAQNVRERIVEPLGLKETYLENWESVPDKSIGYLKIIDGIEDNLNMITEPRPDGGFWATANDVLIFYRNFFHGNKLLSEKAKMNSNFFSEIKSFYDKPGRGIPMAGGMNGLNTVHIEMLNDDISIIVLANMDEPVAEKIGIGILDLLNGRELEKAKLPAALNAYNAWKTHGIDFVKVNFEDLTTNFHPTDPKDLILNNMGYNLLFSDRIDEALVIFKLNTELFPNVANVWDSYGQALKESGNSIDAIQAYKKAIELDPNMETALDALKELWDK